VAVGALTTRRIRSDFNHQISAAAEDLRARLAVDVAHGQIVGVSPQLDAYAGAGHAVIRVLIEDGSTVIGQTRGAPNLGLPFAGTAEVSGYRVETREKFVEFGPFGGPVYIQYARRVSDLEATLARLRGFLIIGVLGGTGLALLAGLMIARRAMAPIAQLTNAAREIALTRDPRRQVPVGATEADDEVAELALTLNGMLSSLADANSEVEDMLVRQRQFVADASHELRTPLTSVLANLELLAEHLHGEEGEAARSALRSSQRMRRLVGDLLLLARADVASAARRQPVDLAQVAIEAAAELGPLSQGHELSLDVEPAVTDGVRDDLHRVAVNLIENALRHTPPGTRVWVMTRSRPDGQVELVVADDGPGVPEGLGPRLFERFVRGAGDRGGSSYGIGLAIVRAVAETHDGSVGLEDRAGDANGAGGASQANGTSGAVGVGGVGSCFVVVLPGAVGDGGKLPDMRVAAGSVGAGEAAPS